MKTFFQSVGLLILRLGFGGMMLYPHGWGKLMKYSDLADKFPDPIGLGSQFSLIAAIGAEVGCAALLMVGLFTRVAAIPLAFTMIVACFVVHSADPFEVKEKAALYLAAYLTLIFTGGGGLSLDGLIFRKKTVERSANSGD